MTFNGLNKRFLLFDFHHIFIKSVFLTLSVLGEDAGCNAADVFFTDAVVAHLKTHNTDVKGQ